MTLTVGNSNIEAVYKAGNIGEIYKGSQLLWSSGVLLTINTTPTNASCSIIYNGKTYNTKTLKVKKGSTVTYSLSYTGYMPVRETITVDEARTVNVNMVRVKNLGIFVEPRTAEITINGVRRDNYNYNYLPFPVGTVINYSISAAGYIPQSGSFLIDEKDTLNISLKQPDFPTNYGRLLRVYCTNTRPTSWGLGQILGNSFGFIFENGYLGVYVDKNETEFSFTNQCWSNNNKVISGTYIGNEFNSVSYSENVWKPAFLYIGPADNSSTIMMVWVNENSLALRLNRLDAVPSPFNQVNNPYWTATVGNNQCKIYYKGQLKATLDVLTY